MVLVIDVKEHPVFKRRGADLIMKKEITLLESLTGVDFEVAHVGGHRLRVTSPRGTVLKPDLVLQVPDEGMPVGGHGHVKGVLFVQFEVAFPDRLDITDAMAKILAGVLPKPDKAGPPTPGAVARALEPADMEARAMRERLGKDAHDSDEEQQQGQGGVRCAQQ